MYDESELDEEGSGSSDNESASSSYKDNWQQQSTGGHQMTKAIRKKKTDEEMSKFSATSHGLQLVVDKGMLASDSGQFPSHSKFAPMKSVANSCSQTADGADPLVEEEGTTPNDLLLSLSSEPHPSIDDPFMRQTKWAIPTNIREVLAANKNSLAAGGLITRMLDSNLVGVASNSQSLYCHRSVGTQTLPDNEYPSHIYYNTSDFASHVVEPSDVKYYITPEELPSRKQIVQDSLPEGTLRLVIQNFSLMTDTVRGPSKVVQGVPWRIMVMPRQHIVQKKGTQKCLGFFLQCCPDAYSDSWSCQAAAELRLISQKQGIPNFTRKTNHVYTAKENDWGYSCFMTWADILDENQGYILNDIVILEVHVKADQAKNILSLNEFRKKIQEYIRVAQMQCERGLIDKAIDCNSQAMKFCKDKDPECLRRLQAQNADLVARKLKQSIARIERGGENAALDPDPAANVAALRIAMSGNTTATKSTAANRSKRSKDARTVEKKRDNDQNNEQIANVDNNSVDNQSLKNDPVNASPIVSDKENDSQIEGVEIENTDKCSASELHTFDYHCNKGITCEQLASIDPEIIKAAALLEEGDLLKCLEEVANDHEAIQLTNDLLSEQLNEEIPEKMLPIRFELLARSLICHGGYTFAEIVENESNALFQLITNQKNVIQNERFSDELYRSLFTDDLQNFTKIESNDKRHQSVCKSVRKYLMTVDSECQTEFPSLSQITQTMGNKRERRLEKQVNKELEELVRKISSSEPNESIVLDNANERADQDTQQVAESAKRAMTSTEKKLKSSNPSQKEVGKAGSQRSANSRSRGRPATPSGTPLDIVTRSELKEGQFIRLNKEFGGRLKTFQGVSSSKSSPGKSCFEIFASGTSAKSSGKSQAKMQFECERHSYEFLEQHGCKMSPNYLNYFFNQMLKSFPDPSTYNSIMEQMRYRPNLAVNSNNSSPTSFHRPCEIDLTKANNLDEELHNQRLASVSNFMHPTSFKEMPRRTRCSTYPPTVTSRLQDIRAYNEEHRETMTRVSLRLYELMNRTVDTTCALVSYFETQMHNLFQSPNVYEFPVLLNSLITFCSEYSLEKGIEEMHVSEPGKLSLKIFEPKDCTRYIFENQGEKTLIQHYAMYFAAMQSILSTNHIEIVPLVKKIMTFALEQKRKTEEMTKEVETMRNEQKAWTKEKNQMQKMQKNEKTMNQRFESAKQECNQLKNHQKNWQKREVELNDEVSRLRQQIESLNSKIQDRDAQHSRDLQSLHDVKRNHSKDLADRQSAMQKLKEQLEEKNATAKKWEQQCGQEKRNAQKLIERAKAAEIALVDSRTEQAIRLLERARADSEPLVKQIDDRLEIGGLTDDEVIMLRKDLALLQKYKDDINKLIEESRAEGLKHSEQIKEGKQLSQLPRVTYPKPPALPICQIIPPIRKPQIPVEIPKVFLSPHTQQPIQSSPLPSMSMPPPQATSAFRPLNNNPPPPPSFSNQPPPGPSFMSNGSVQQQMMAQYMPQNQQQRPNIPLFTQTNQNTIPSAAPGPIGSRPINFQSNTLVDQLRNNGLDRPNLSTFAAADSPNCFKRSCTPAELEQIERMKNVRALWDQDNNLPSFNALNTINAPSDLNINVSKLFQSEHLAKTSKSSANGQPGSASSDATTQNTWGSSYGSNIWSFDS